jgi:hypothetical protein
MSFRVSALQAVRAYGLRRKSGSLAMLAASLPTKLYKDSVRSAPSGVSSIQCVRDPNKLHDGNCCEHARNGIVDLAGSDSCVRRAMILWFVSNPNAH